MAVLVRRTGWGSAWTLVMCLAAALCLALTVPQAIAPGRECDPGDWAYNTEGGLAGAVIGWLLLRGYTTLRSRRTPTSQSPEQPIRSGTVR